MTNKHPKVFISYSDKDTFLARIVTQKLQSFGYEPSKDDAETHMANSFSDSLVDSIKHSDLFVVLLTPQSIGKAHIWAEMGAAFAARVKIISTFTGMSIDQVRQQDIFRFLELDDPIPLEEFYDEIDNLALTPSG